MPVRLDGLTIEPIVSAPIAKPTSPAAVATAEPDDEPVDPRVGTQGFIVWPRYQVSLSPSSPMASLATSTAPAASSRSTTVAVSSRIRFS
ncbi:MAG: hypothetical protein R2882_10610 [Gemmatimonadales bacterium]